MKKSKRWFLLGLTVLGLTICFNSLVAQSSLPDIKWAYGFNPIDKSSDVQNVKVNSQKQVYLSGSTNGPTDVDMGPGTVHVNGDGFLVKYDDDKKLMWAKNFHGPAAGITINTIYLDGDSIIYLMGDFSGTFDADPSDAGYFTLTSVTKPNTGVLNDVFIIKLTSDGNFIWAKAMGGKGMEESGDLCKDPYGNIYVTARFEDTVDVDPGPGVKNLIIDPANHIKNVFVCKLDPQGQYVWAFALSLNMSRERLFVQNNQLTLMGSFSQKVDFDPGPGMDTIKSDRLSIFLAHYDLNSNYLSKQYFWTEYGEIHPFDMIYKGNNYYLTGFFSSDIHYISPDTVKNVLTSEPGLSGAFIIRMNNTFAIEKAVAIKNTPELSNSSVYLHAVDVDELNNMYVAGYCTNTIDMDPGPAEFNVDEGILFSKYSKDGDLITAFSLKAPKGGSFLSAWDIATMERNRFYLAGRFTGTVDFNPGTGNYPLSLPGPTINGFLARYGGCEHYYSINAEICHGQSYAFAGKQLTEAGTYKHNFETKGCDSIVTLTLAVKHLNTETFVTSSSIKSLENTATSIQWFNCTTNNPVPGANDTVFSPVDNDDYAAIITKNGCTDTTTCQSIFSNTNAGVPAIAWANKVDKAMWGNTKFLKTDQYGNVYITGSFTETINLDLKGGSYLLSSSGSSPDLFLAKYNNSGVLQWGFSLGSQGISGNAEYGDCLYIDKEGNIYLTGIFRGTMDFDPGPGEFPLSSNSSSSLYFASYNTMGQLRWVKMIDASAGSIYPHSLLLDNNLDIILTGWFIAPLDFNPDAGTNLLQPAAVSSLNPYSGFVATYSNSGTYKSAYSIAGFNVGMGQAPKVAIDKNNNRIITGGFDQYFDFNLKTGKKEIYSTEDIYLAKYTANMDLLWVITIGKGGGKEQAFNVAVDDTNAIYLRGTTIGDADLSGGLGTGITTVSGDFIAKYNANGVFQLKYPFYSLGGASNYMDLVLDKSGNLYVTGAYKYEFDPGNGKVLSEGDDDGFVAKYTNDGTLSWAFTLVGKNEERVQTISLDDNGNFFIAGTFTDTVDFDPRPSNYYLSTSPVVTYFIAKYGQDCYPINTTGVLKGDTLKLNAKNSFYTWVDCNTNKVIATTTNSNYIPSAPGIYKAIIYQGDCMDTTACYPVITTDIKTEQSELLSIYPNPATTQLTILSDYTSEIQAIQLMDVTGKIVAVEVISRDATGITLSVTNLVEGIYFICAIMNDRTVKHLKFVKQ